MSGADGDIDSIEALHALYGPPAQASLTKVVTRIEGEHARWIAASRFCVLTTVGPEGTDASPRGDIGPVARILDPQTLAIPDWKGNNRLDSLRNIVRDGRVSLMFMVPGSVNVVRVNGTARLSADPDVTGIFDDRGTLPVTVILVTVTEAYVQCAKALLRSDLWREGDRSSDVPTAGALIAEGSSGEHGGAAYDEKYRGGALDRVW